MQNPLFWLQLFAPNRHSGADRAIAQGAIPMHWGGG